MVEHSHATCSVSSDSVIFEFYDGRHSQTLSDHRLMINEMVPLQNCRHVAQVDMIDMRFFPGTNNVRFKIERKADIGRWGFRDKTGVIFRQASASATSAYGILFCWNRFVIKSE